MKFPSKLLEVSADTLVMMTITAEGIRQHFRDWVRSQVGQEVPVSIRETTLLCDGSYVGRKFALAGYQLVWLIASEELRFYQRDGLLVECSQKASNTVTISTPGNN
jgi:hypothetical protein